jgi:hypothetical protein
MPISMYVSRYWSLIKTHRQNCGVEGLRKWSRPLKGGFAMDVQDLDISVIEEWPPGAVLATEIYSASSSLSCPESSS